MDDVTYDLLEELLDEDYDKFDDGDRINVGEKINSCKQGTEVKELFQKQKKKTVDMYELEEGEIFENESATTEISYFFQDDKLMLNSYHDIFNRNHLILKIYENCEHCPYCISKDLKINVKTLVHCVSFTEKKDRMSKKPLCNKELG